MLQRVAAASIHRRIDLDVTPGKHQQGGETPVQVIDQVGGANRKDRIAGQPHQQHPLIAHGSHGSMV
jgi:hypothetical protein